MFGCKINTPKKAFTLVEIILVVFIISIVYIVMISNINNSSSINNKLVLKNIKQKLLTYDFKDNIELKCINEGNLCFIFVDGNIIDEKIENLFKTKPTVYTYDTKLNIIEFDELEFEKLETYDVCFAYKINKYLKIDDMIVQLDDKIYIFNSIDKKAVLIEYLSDVNNYFDDKKQEVKDAF